MEKLDNFLISFFWPKEMQALVKHYQLDGSLNRKALVHFKYQIVKRHLLFLAVAGILILVWGF